PFCLCRILRPATSPLFPYTTLFRSLTEWLEAQRIIARAQQGGYVLTRDPAEMELAEVLEALPEAMPPVSTLPVSLGESDLWYPPDRKSTRLNSSHVKISYAVFCLKK